MPHKDFLEELRHTVEGLGVALRMNGGRGTVHPQRALEAFQEFAKR